MAVTSCPVCSTLMRAERPCPTCHPSIPGLSAMAMLGLLVSGCGSSGSSDSGVVALYGVEIVDDDDGDGYNAAQDCNDADPDIHPCATETDGDGVDSNCDGIDGVDATVDQGCP